MNDLSKVVALVVIGAVVVLWLMFSSMPAPQEEEPPVVQHSRTEPASPQSRITYGEAVWKERAPDGSIPVGVWSEWIPNKQNCTLGYTLSDYAESEGEDLFGKVTPIKRGDNPTGNARTRFKVIKPGMQTFPYEETCS